MSARNFEMEHRYHKAWTLQRWILRNGYPLSLVSGWSEVQWEYAAKKCGVNIPSEKTQRMVTWMVAGHEERKTNGLYASGSSQ